MQQACLLLPQQRIPLRLIKMSLCTALFRSGKLRDPQNAADVFIAAASSALRVLWMGRNFFVEQGGFANCEVRLYK